MQPLSALELAYAYAVAAVPDGTTVETQVNADASRRTPHVVIGTSTPRSVNNGPAHLSAEFVINVTAYAENPVEALALARETYAGFHRLWRSRFVTEYGWISSILRSSRHPQVTASTLKADGISRFDAALHVVART